MAKRTAIVWIRNDLRMSDNRAFFESAKSYRIVPVFIHAADDEGNWPIGAASAWWLHQSLSALDKSLAKYGSRLVIRQGPTLSTLLQLVSETSAQSVFWNKRYEQAARDLEKTVFQELAKQNVDCRTFDSNLLFAPGSVSTREGNPYRVFTPFWKALPEPEQPIPKPEQIQSPDLLPESVQLAELKLLPEIDWAAGIRESWNPGEDGAMKQFNLFLNGGVSDYETGRDRPDKMSVSRMSPHIHFGEIGPRFLFHSVKQKMGIDSTIQTHGESYLRQLVWREFAYNVLFHFPDSADHPLKAEFNRFPWSRNEQLLKAWQKGQTGYPIVDAGMRELWHTGWMHNRVRMIAASFLVKHLLVSWKDGARWFWDTLVDADLANNTMGWQWVAGCGVDAAPYFRIFNPIVQGEKFDPDGQYVRHWVPELKKLNNKWIHKPWLAKPLELASAGIELGTTYPDPIVDHKSARQKALVVFDTIKR